MTRLREIDARATAHALARVLRRHVGRNLTFEPHEVCEILDLDRRTLDSYLRGERTPGAPMLLRMFGLPEIGAAIAAEMLATVGLACFDAAPVPDGADPSAALAELASATALFAELQRDRRIGPDQAAELDRRLLALAQHLAGYVHARRARRGAP